MKKLILLPIIMLFFISFVIATSPIGYEYFRHHGKDHIHTWNQNTDENNSNIWFKDRNNKPYLQFFNGEDWEEALDRSDWITFNYGIGYYYAGDFRILTDNHLNHPEYNITTDNETFWEMNLYKCDNFGDLDYCAGFNRGQEVNDEYMRNSFFFETDDFTSPYNTSYIWGFEDIDIGNDGSNDMIKYCYIETDYDTNVSFSQCNITSIGNTGEFIVYDLVSLDVYDSVLNVGHSLWWENDIDIRLRFDNGEFMLEAPMNLYEHWSGREQVTMYWIDFDISQDFNMDITNDVTGFILYLTSLNNYYVYDNTQPQTSDNYQQTIERRGYRSYNLSILPDTLTKDNITTVQFHQTISTISVGSPTNWRDLFYGTTDLGVLDHTDWNQTPIAIGVDWSNYCGGNVPCTTWIPLPTTGFGMYDVRDDILIAANGSKVFTIANKDNSQYRFGDMPWSYNIFTGHRSVLEINFTVPDYELYNLTIDFPINNSVYTINDSSEVVEIYINGTSYHEYMLEFCYFRSGDKSRSNSTDVEPNEPFGYGYGVGNLTRWGYADNGSYWMEVNCTDLWGKKGTAGKIYFNITQAAITGKPGPLIIVPNKEKYPFTVTNSTLHRIIISENNQISSIYPKLRFNKTLNMSIFPNCLGYPIVRK